MTLDAARVRRFLKRVQAPHVAARLLQVDWTLPEQPSIVRIPAAPVSAPAIALCHRLIAAYGRSMRRFRETEDLSSIWRGFLDRQYRPLIDLLDGGDAEGLAAVLAQMFSMPFLEGISSNHMGRRAVYPRAHAVAVTLKRLARLAEFVGAARAENPDQGPVHGTFSDGIDRLVARIEAQIGMPVTVPPVGAPVGIGAGGSVITKESPEDVYVALRVDERVRALGAGPVRHVAEIGAGFGGTAYWLLLRRSDIARYTIIDLPIVNVVQGYYLGTVFGPDAVVLFGEEEALAAVARRIHVLPTFAIHDAGAIGAVDVLLNADSMPEMTERAVAEYLHWARQVVTAMFCSFNHEADAHAQTCVPDVVRAVGGFSRIFRDRNWVRDGYVDEVYVPVGAVPIRAFS